jgi:hypothetical protein
VLLQAWQKRNGAIYGLVAGKDQSAGIMGVNGENVTITTAHFVMGAAAVKILNRVDHP